MPGIQLADPYASAELQRIERVWLRDLHKRSAGIRVGAPPGEPPKEPAPEADAPFWRRALNWFGAGAQMNLESYNDALHDNTRSAVLPVRTDPQTGDMSLAMPRMLDVINTLPSPATAGSVVLGAGGSVGKAAKALDLSTEARMARARSMGFDTSRPVYHGTSKDFPAFDPTKTGDIGMHVGTPEQASRAAADAWSGKPVEGSQVMPLYAKTQNPLRVKDTFSTLGQRHIARAKALSLETPGFYMNDAEHAAMYEAAKRADAARKRGGGDYSMRLDDNKKGALEAYRAADSQFWDTVEQSMRRQGFDSMVYANKVEGKGDSYMVLDPNQLRSVHARFDPAKSDSADLLASRAAPGGITLGSQPHMTPEQFRRLYEQGGAT